MNTNNPLPNLLITGTPGVGKTSLALLLTDKLNEQIQQTSDKRFNYINIGKLITDKKLYTEWNKEFDVPEFDEDMVVNELNQPILDGGCILDFHSSYFIPEDWLNYIVLLRCDNTILYDRLAARGYNEKKIKENIECEIMEVTADDVKENFSEYKIIEIKNEQVDDMEKIIEIIWDKIKGNN